MRTLIFSQDFLHAFVLLICHGWNKTGKNESERTREKESWAIHFFIIYIFHPFSWFCHSYIVLQLSHESTPPKNYKKLPKHVLIPILNQLVFDNVCIVLSCHLRIKQLPNTCLAHLNNLISYSFVLLFHRNKL